MNGVLLDLFGNIYHGAGLNISHNLEKDLLADFLDQNFEHAMLQTKMVLADESIRKYSSDFLRARK